MSAGVELSFPAPTQSLQSQFSPGLAKQRALLTSCRLLPQLIQVLSPCQSSAFQEIEKSLLAHGNHSSPEWRHSFFIWFF
jgi:hypothetical protein